MSSFFDKAKDKATQLANQAKEKVDETQNKRKVDGLLDDIGRIVYRQRTTGTIDPGDDAAIDDLVAQLKAIEEQGIDVAGNAAAAAAADTPADAPATSTLPPPPSPAPAVSTEPSAPLPMPEPGNG